MIADPAAGENARLEALSRYELDFVRDDPEFNALTAIVASCCHTPMAAISFVVSDRVLIKSALGLKLREWPRQRSFASSTLSRPDQLLVVENAARDPRFVDHPLVVNKPHLRFVAAAPLVAPKGHAVGLISVADVRDRKLSDSEGQALRLLAGQVMRLLELRHTVHRLNGEISEHTRFERELMSTNARLGAAALQDAVTGLGNRRAFEQRLVWEIQRANRLAYPLSLLTIDVDEFKHINDEWGHPVGDQVLREVGKALRAAARTTDFVARVGGDEFAVILPGADIEGAAVLGRRCRCAVAGQQSVRPVISISVGVAQHTGHSQDILELVAKSDSSLLSAKRLHRYRNEGKGLMRVQGSRALGLSH